MSDESYVVFGLALAGSIVVAVVKAVAQGAKEVSATMAHTRQVREVRAGDIQTRSERRAIELLLEFPNLDDSEVAMLMRDELMNMRTPHREYYAWATPETVGRMRRTILVEVARQGRGSSDR